MFFILVGKSPGEPPDAVFSVGECRCYATQEYAPSLSSRVSSKEETNSLGKRYNCLFMARNATQGRPSRRGCVPLPYNLSLIPSHFLRA